MQRIENIRASWTDSTGVRHVVADLQVSTADELPALGGYVGVNVIEAGTIAQVIQADTFVTLDEDGNWYPEEEDAEDAADEAITLSAPLTLGRTVEHPLIEPDFEGRGTAEPEPAAEDGEGE